MQWLGLVILLGILITLFLAARYFGDTHYTHNERPKSARDDFYHSRGMVHVPNAREKLDEIAAEQHRRSSPRRH
jgi:hypothetical protein